MQHEQQLAKAVEGRQIATIWGCSLWQQLQTMRQLLADQAAQCSGATAAAAAAAGTESQGSSSAKSPEEHMSAHEDNVPVSKVSHCALCYNCCNCTSDCCYSMMLCSTVQHVGNSNSLCIFKVAAKLIRVCPQRLGHGVKFGTDTTDGLKEMSCISHLLGCCVTSEAVAVPLSLQLVRRYHLCTAFCSWT